MQKKNFSLILLFGSSLFGMDSEEYPKNFNKVSPNLQKLVIPNKCLSEENLDDIKRFSNKEFTNLIFEISEMQDSSEKKLEARLIDCLARQGFFEE